MGHLKLKKQNCMHFCWWAEGPALKLWRSTWSWQSSLRCLLGCSLWRRFAKGISIRQTISCYARGHIWRQGSRVGKWVLSKYYPTGRGPCKECLLRMSPSLPTDKVTIISHLEKVTCLFAGRIRLWHHFRTSSESDSSSLDRQNLLLNSKFLRPKMMSCSFEKLQFLEYYQEKKVIFLEFSPPSRCPEKETVSQSSPGNTACRKTHLLPPCFLHIRMPWKP